jgi:hypothetical protein
MKSGVIQLAPETRSAAEVALAAERVMTDLGITRAPDLVCAFMPAGADLEARLDGLATAWPESLRLGCEAVTQFADSTMTGDGSVQAFWFEDASHRAEPLLVRGTAASPPAEEAVARAARRLEAGSAGFILADGLRFPMERFLRDLRRALRRSAAEPEPGSGPGSVSGAGPAQEATCPVLVGGLASQSEPIAAVGARIFLDREVIEGASLLVVLHGIDMEVEIVRGWDPASPIYTVTSAEGNTLYTIDHEPATEWFRRFFTLDGELAPLPESAYRFPLIVDGPKPERRNLYRSMRDFGEPPGAVRFWGDLEDGDRIRLGIGNDASLLRTARRLPRTRPADAAMLYSCVGREAVLDELAAREVATIHEALGGASLAGFFTFGEVGPSAAGSVAFYNHTAVLALLRELRP